MINSEKMNQLINAALGKEKADLVIVNGVLLNVYTGELLKDHSVAIKGERIAYVGKEIRPTIGPETKVIDAREKILIPGFIDGHTHLLYFYCIDQFLRYAMKGGTTSIITETLEIAFPLGYQGVLQFLKTTRNQPIKIFAVAPAMVSLNPTAQAKAIEKEKIWRLLKRKEVLGLGESYWHPVIQGDQRLLGLFSETLRLGKKLVGHTPGARDRKLNAYLTCGISSCHESITLEEAKERLRLGIHVLIREGDIRRDLEAISKIKDENIDLRRLALVTDGIGPKHLIEKGYMEFVVQKAINLGFDPIIAIQMATINVAEYLSLDHIIGGIAPGRYADIVIIPNIRRIQAEYVISNGQIIARDGQLMLQPKPSSFPKWAFKGLRLSKDFKPTDFDIRVNRKNTQVTARVIDQVTNLVTRELQMAMPVTKGKIEVDTEKDILKVAAIDYSIKPRKMFTGLIRGFKMKRGAFSSSGAWDLPAIIVVGAGEEDMANAVGRVIELGGGIAISLNNQILAEFSMPIGGILSPLPIEIIAQKLDEIQQKAVSLGIPFPDAHLTLATLTTPAIPFFRICEEGLVNISEGKFVDLIV